MLLFPAHPLNARLVDEHFAAEADAARAAGWPVAVIDDDALRRGDATAAVKRVPAGASAATYRGWMLRGGEYQQLADALAERDVRLRTAPDRYVAGHELPGWYATFSAHTALSRWLHGPGLDGIEALVAELPDGGAVIKDYVKSEKRAWHEATYIPDVRDLEAVRRIAGRFLELRDAELVGGIVVREFEHYLPPEVRTWWRDGQHVLTTAHPDAPDASVPEVPAGTLKPCVDTLGSPFITIDLARHAAGGWRVIEVGDGQVSDRPRSTAAADFIGALSLG